MYNSINIKDSSDTKNITSYYDLLNKCHYIITTSLHTSHKYITRFQFVYNTWD